MPGFLPGGIAACKHVPLILLMGRGEFRLLPATAVLDFRGLFTCADREAVAPSCLIPLLFPSPVTVLNLWLGTCLSVLENPDGNEFFFVIKMFTYVELSF